MSSELIPFHTPTIGEDEIHSRISRRLLPDKIWFAKEYIRRSSLFFDLSLIVRTALKLFSTRSIA
jgi:lipopolysaccharide/colanic/teichoic acid biosynthesis glycosyltransferase